MGSRGRRVLIVVQNLPVPFDRRVWLEATTLQQNGYQVSVICPKLKGFNKSRETLENVDIYRYRLPIDPNSKIGFVAEFLWAWVATSLLSLRVAWRGRGFDVIHACNPPETYWLLGRLWRLGGKKFIFDHHDLSPEMYQAKFGGNDGTILRILRWLERRSFKAASVAIATNESHKRIAVERGGMDPADVFVVRSGPDLKRFTRYPRDDSWAKSKKHVIAYLGDISAQDGVDGLIRVVRLLKEMRDDFHTVVIGGGSAWENVKRYAAAEGVDDLFTFTGVVSDDDLCRILSSVTIAVDTVPKNPWSDKSTMNKIVEYMYFGLPVVAYDLAETIESAEDAMVAVAAGNEHDFAESISTLLDDEGARDRMSATGSERLTTRLSWGHSAPVLLEAYERATASFRS